MKRIFWLLLFLGLITTGFAQVFSNKLMISETAKQPLVVISADLNNDGFDDVIYSSLEDNKISINLFNPDTAGFDQAILLGTQFPYCTSLFAADLDNDGLTDILAVSQTSKKVGWYKNNGNGDFTLQPFINENATLAAGVTAADIDLDGDMDVISVQKTDKTVLLYLNNGNGTFEAPFVITNQAEIPVTVTTGKLNDDQYPDLVVGYGQTDKIVIFLNNGDGTFQNEYAITDQADYITNIVVCDMNGDQLPDIVSASRNDNKIAWYPNEGNAVFNQQIIIADNVTGIYGLTAADFDLDGDMDVAASSPNNNKVYLFQNNELTFSPFVVSSEVKEPKGVAAGDFNNDGLPDIAVADSWSAGYTNPIYWYKNGASAFVVHPIDESISSWHLALNDYNHDGNTDIFYSDGQFVKIVSSADSGASFQTPEVLYENGYNILSFGFMDANNDGWDDLFILDAMGDLVFWYQNFNGNFITPLTLDDQGDGPASIDFSDVNNDGNTDFLVAYLNGNKIAVFVNQGNGSFNKTVIADTVNPYSVCFIDYDNDGDDDIAYSDLNNIRLLKNSGTGTFTPGPTVVNSGYCWDLKRADINQDGYEDLLAAPDDLHWYENNHDGTFTDHQEPTYGGCYHFTAADFDNDNKTDMLSAGGIVNRAYLLRNLDNGENFDVSVYAEENDVRAVDHSDINKDGYQDMILGLWPTERLSWAENYLYRIIRQPQNREACLGGYVSLTILTAGVTHFQWQMNDGNGWTDIQDNETFAGTNKAKLILNNIPENLFNNQFRCVVLDYKGMTHESETAVLSRVDAAIFCVPDQQVSAESNGIYTVQGTEFDPDSVFNPCNQTLTLTNSYNNNASLQGEAFGTGTYEIVWYLQNSQGENLDSCSFTLSVEPYTTIGELDKGIKIYPNPTPDHLIVSLENEWLPAYIHLTDLNGRIIRQKGLNDQHTTINLSNFAPGIYLLKIRTKDRLFIQKVVKE